MHALLNFYFLPNYISLYVRTTMMMTTTATTTTIQQQFTSAEKWRCCVCLALRCVLCYVITFMHWHCNNSWATMRIARRMHWIYFCAISTFWFALDRVDVYVRLSANINFFFLFLFFHALSLLLSCCRLSFYHFKISPIVFVDFQFTRPACPFSKR